MLFNRKKKQFGQGMVEYLIIVALIGIAAIGVYSLFGKTLRNQGAGLSKELSGQDGGTQITSAQTAATKAGSVGNQAKDMGKYNLQNQAQ